MNTLPAARELLWGLQKKLGASPVKPFILAGYNISLNIDEAIQRRIYFDGFEPEETKWIYLYLKPGMTFVDAGCNIGYYSLIASSLVGDTGSVYSFDPSRYACSKLMQTISDNNIKNIHVACCGLGDKKTTMNLRRRVDDMHSPSFCYPDSNPELENLGDANVISLDEFMGCIKKIDMIKIDVEGYEPNVIRGMHNLLESGRVTRIMIELNEGWLVHNSSTPLEVDLLIKSYGFVQEHSNFTEGTPDHIIMGNVMYVNEGELS